MMHPRAARTAQLHIFILITIEIWQRCADKYTLGTPTVTPRSPSPIRERYLSLYLVSQVSQVPGVDMHMEMQRCQLGSARCRLGSARGRHYGCSASTSRGRGAA